MAANAGKMHTPVVLEITDNKEDNVNYVSTQSKKRTQRQARLNYLQAAIY